MSRKFGVHHFTWTKHLREELVGTTSKYVVADWVNDAECEQGKATYRTPIAEFPVDSFRDKESQREIAMKLCDYLNDIRAAQEKAVNDDALLQRIMLPHTDP